MAIPYRKPSHRGIHLDTSVLLCALAAFPDERELHGPGRTLLYKDGEQAMVCFAALGEALHVLTDPRRGLPQEAVLTILENLARHIKSGRITLVGFGQTEDSTFELAHRLRKDEPRLRPTDAIIIANMCVNEDADCLVTMDEFAEWTEVTSRVETYRKQLVGFQR